MALRVCFLTPAVLIAGLAIAPGTNAEPWHGDRIVTMVVATLPVLRSSEVLSASA